MTQEEIDQMTGAASMNRPYLARRKAIRLNGKTGKFIITHLDEDKEKVDGVEKYKQEEVKEIEPVVFLKIRRRLMQGSQKDGIIKYTTEHDTVNDIVTLHIKDGEREQGPANLLRDKHPELKTEQIVYVRWKGEVCKLSVKGLSLRGSKDTNSFYEFISGRNDWYTHRTTLTAHQDEESGYWFLNFTVGEKLNEEQKAEVIDNIKEVHEDCQKVKEDEDKNRPVVAEVGTLPPEIEMPAGSTRPDYPEEEELDESAIPF